MDLNEDFFYFPDSISSEKLSAKNKMQFQLQTRGQTPFLAFKFEDPYQVPVSLVWKACPASTPSPDDCDSSWSRSWENEGEVFYDTPESSLIFAKLCVSRKDLLLDPPPACDPEFRIADDWCCSPIQRFDLQNPLQQGQKVDASLVEFLNREKNYVSQYYSLAENLNGVAQDEYERLEQIRGENQYSPTVLQALLTLSITPLEDLAYKLMFQKNELDHFLQSSLKQEEKSFGLEGSGGSAISGASSALPSVGATAKTGVSPSSTSPPPDRGSDLDPKEAKLVAMETITRSAGQFRVMRSKRRESEFSVGSLTTHYNRDDTRVSILLPSRVVFAPGDDHSRIIADIEGVLISNKAMGRLAVIYQHKEMYKRIKKNLEEFSRSLTALEDAFLDQMAKSDDTAWTEADVRAKLASFLTALKQQNFSGSEFNKEQSLETKTASLFIVDLLEVASRMPTKAREDFFSIVQEISKTEAWTNLFAGENLAEGQVSSSQRILLNLRGLLRLSMEEADLVQAQRTLGIDEKTALNIQKDRDPKVKAEAAKAKKALAQKAEEAKKAAKKAASAAAEAEEKAAATRLAAEAEEKLRLAAKALEEEARARAAALEAKEAAFRAIGLAEATARTEKIAAARQAEEARLKGERADAARQARERAGALQALRKKIRALSRPAELEEEPEKLQSSSGPQRRLRKAIDIDKIVAGYGEQIEAIADEAANIAKKAANQAAAEAERVTELEQARLLEEARAERVARTAAEDLERARALEEARAERMRKIKERTRKAKKSEELRTTAATIPAAEAARAPADTAGPASLLPPLSTKAEQPSTGLRATGGDTPSVTRSPWGKPKLQRPSRARYIEGATMPGIIGANAPQIRVLARVGLAESEESSSLERLYEVLDKAVLLDESRMSNWQQCHALYPVECP